jgi:hypothetical protein
MPVLERDPWRLQYFEHVPCPEHVAIPTDDPDCWLLSPAHRWIYDKLKLAQAQGLDAGPHGVPPVSYPVFSKPITNLKGMGIGSRIIRSAAEIDQVKLIGVEWLRDSDRGNRHVDRSPLAAPLEYGDVAAVGVDVHLIGVEMAEPHVSTHAVGP